MKKGYWTGNLARMVEDTKIGNLNYKITSNAHYSVLLNMEHVTWNRNIYVPSV